MPTPPHSEGQIDEDARRNFESAWLEDQPASIESLLPDTDSPAFLPTLEELICIEMEFAWKARASAGSQQPSRVADYLTRFPVLDIPEIRERLLEEEKQIRRRHSDESTREIRLHQPNASLETRTGNGNDEDAQDTLTEDLPRVPGYEIYGLLGRGGMGLVLKANQLNLGRIVALKMIWLGGVGRTEDRARLRTEAEAVARLHHPNVVQIYEVAEHNGCPFLTLEYMNGGNLSAWTRGKPQEPRAAAGLIATIAGAIHHAHQRGIIHRDLKPANILIQRVESASDNIRLGDANLIPKVGDFGLAKVLGETQARQTQTGAVLGTPSYMAPEQTGGGDADVGTPADVYALGALLFELLTGRPPFQAASALETMALVRNQEPESPGKLNPSVPLDLATICLTCLAKDPAKRYGSAQALSDDLGRFLGGEPILARPVSRAERVQKWVRRRPAWAALIAVSAASVITLLAVELVNNNRLKKQRDIATTLQGTAEEQRNRAMAHLREAREAVDTLLTRVGFDRLDAEPHMEKVRLELVKDAVRFYEGFVQQEVDDLELKLEAIKSWRRLGKMHAFLGHEAEASESYRAALSMAKKLTAQAPDEPRYSAELAACENNLADSYSTQENPGEEALQNIERAIELQTKLVDAHPGRIGFVASLSNSYDVLGRLHVQKGHRKEAEKAFRHSIELLESSEGVKWRDNRDFAIALAKSKRNLGTFLAQNKRFDEAEPIFRQDKQFWDEILADAPSVPRNRARAGDATQYLGQFLFDQQRPAEAEQFYRSALELRRPMVEEFPQVPEYYAALVQSEEKLARLLRARKQHLKAVAVLKEGVAQAELHARRTKPTDPDKGMHSTFAWLLADSYLELEDHKAAAQLCEPLTHIIETNWQECYQASRLMTRCVVLAAKDELMGESARRQVAEAYAKQAVKFMRESFRRGCPEYAYFKSDKGLDVLRSRDDFKQLAAELSAKNVPKE